MRVTPTFLSLLTAVAAFALVATSPAADLGRTPLIPDGRSSDRGNARERVTFQAILVVASDEGTTDSSLSAYEAQLRRMLHRQAYRRVGGGTAVVAVGGDGAIALGAGQRLTIKLESAWDNQVMAVLSGPTTADGKGTFIVIIIPD
jgi:hypothetical protein